jgi:hypothetical protein
MGPFKDPRCGGTAPPSKKRRLNRRDTDEQAREALARQCPGLSQAMMTQHIVNGLSLLECVKEDKRKARKENKNLGPNYWREIKQLYDIEDTIEGLVVLDKSETIDEELSRAIEQARNPNAGKRSLNLLQSWCGSVREVNQRGMVAVVRQIFGIKLGSKGAQTLVMCFM